MWALVWRGCLAAPRETQWLGQTSVSALETALCTLTGEAGSLSSQGHTPHPPVPWPQEMSLLALIYPSGPSSVPAAPSVIVHREPQAVRGPTWARCPLSPTAECSGQWWPLVPQVHLHLPARLPDLLSPQVYMNAVWHGWAIPMFLFLAILRLSLNYLIARWVSRSCGPTAVSQPAWGRAGSSQGLWRRRQPQCPPWLSFITSPGWGL